jgi:hypothetical protein
MDGKSILHELMEAESRYWRVCAHRVADAADFAKGRWA